MGVARRLPVSENSFLSNKTFQGERDMKETWKDYFAPGVLAVGLFSLLIGVAVFGSPTYEREANRSYVTEDTSSVRIMSVSTDESWDEIDFDARAKEESVVASKLRQQKEAEKQFLEFQDEIRTRRERYAVTVEMAQTRETIDSRKPAIATERVSEDADQPHSMERLKACDSRAPISVEEWLGQLRRLMSCNKLSANPKNAPDLVERFTELKESDGAFYYFTVGAVHEQLFRTYRPFRLSNHAKAVEAYQKAINLEKDNAVFHYYLGQADYYLALREDTPLLYERAMTHCQTAESLSSHWVAPVVMQGRCSLALQNNREAIRHFDRAMKIDDQCIDAYLGNIEAWMKISDGDPKNPEPINKGLDNARRFRKVVRKTDRFYLPDYYHQVNTLINRLKEIETITIDTHPEYFANHELSGAAAVHAAAGRYEEAIRLYDVLVENDCIPGWIQNFHFLPSTDLPRRLRADCLYHSGQYNKAVKDYELYFEQRKDVARRTDSTILNASDQITVVHYLKSLLKLAQFQKILDFANEYNIADQRHMHHKQCEILVCIAIAMAKSGKTEEMDSFIRSQAAKLHSKSFVLSVNDDPVFEEFTAIYFDMLRRKAYGTNDSQAATQFTKTYLEHVDACVEKYSGYHVYCRDAAELLAFRQNHAQAAEYYEKYLFYVPEDEQSLYALLGCYELAGKNEDALRIISQLVAIKPDNADYWLERAQISVTVSPDRNSAVQDLTKAIALLEGTPGNDTLLIKAYTWRALEYQRQNHYPNKLMDLKKALEITDRLKTPDFQLVDDILEQGKIDIIIEFITTCIGINAHAEIIERCDSLIEKGGDERILLTSRAGALQSIGQYEQALEDYFLVAGFPKTGKIPTNFLFKDKLKQEHLYHEIGRCYSSMKNYDKAVDYYTLAIEENPGEYWLYDSRAGAYNGIYIHTPGHSPEEKNNYQSLMKQDREKAKELRTRK